MTDLEAATALAEEVLDLRELVANLRARNRTLERRIRAARRPRRGPHPPPIATWLRRTPRTTPSW